MRDTDTMYKEVIGIINNRAIYVGIYMHACRLTTDNMQGAYNVGIYTLLYMYKHTDIERLHVL